MFFLVQENMKDTNWFEMNCIIRFRRKYTLIYIKIWSFLFIHLFIFFTIAYKLLKNHDNTERREYIVQSLHMNMINQNTEEDVQRSRKKSQIKGEGPIQGRLRCGSTNQRPDSRSHSYETNYCVGKRQAPWLEEEIILLIFLFYFGLSKCNIAKNIIF